MDIRVANTYNAYSVFNAKNTPGAKKAERTAKAGENRDQFTLSGAAGDYQTVRKALAGIPDIRSDKVNAIKARIEANTYHVDAGDVAAKMLNGIDE